LSWPRQQTVNVTSMTFVHSYLGPPIKIVRHNPFPSLVTQFQKHCCTLIQASRRKIKKQIGDNVWSRKVPEVNYAALTGTINKLPWNRTFITCHLYHMSLSFSECFPPWALCHLYLDPHPKTAHLCGRHASFINEPSHRLSHLKKTNHRKRTEMFIFSHRDIPQPIPVATRYKAWVCGRSLAVTASSNPIGGMDVYLVGVVCCQVEISATGWSLVQKISTDSVRVCVCVNACARSTITSTAHYMWINLERSGIPPS